jgi:hypothetical protein
MMIGAIAIIVIMVAVVGSALSADSVFTAPKHVIPREYQQPELVKQQTAEQHQAELWKQQTAQQQEAELEKRQAELERQQAFLERRAAQKRQAELVKQQATQQQAELEKRQAELERQQAFLERRAAQKRQAELVKQQATQQQAELEKRQATKQQQAELEKRQAAQQQLESQQAAQKKQADLEMQQAELEKRQTKLEKQLAELEKKQAELNEQEATFASPNPTADSSISCEAARQIIANLGFEDVKAELCTGDTYKFVAMRNGKPFSIEITAANGQVKNVPAEALVVLANQVRLQGQKCDKPSAVERDVFFSKPGLPVWLLTCGEHRYRVELIPHKQARVTQLN